MIAFLRGTLAGRTTRTACVEVGGIGFDVFMPTSDIVRLPEVGTPVSVQTYLHVREDGMALYGFLAQEEKTLFERLIGVSGVGPKVALAALSSYSPVELADAIAEGDAARLARIPGIGKKTAQRIILELKGTLEKDASLFGGASAGETSEGAFAGSARAAAREALLAMGFTSAEVDLALKGAPAAGDDAALLQYALRKLGSA